MRATLRLRFRLGLFDYCDDPSACPLWHVPKSAVRTPSSLALSLQSAREGMVLLKNEGEALPLTPGLRLAVVGPHANATSALVANYIGQICPDNDSESDEFDCVVSPVAAMTSMNVGGVGHGRQR